MQKFLSLRFEYIMSSDLLQNDSDEEVIKSYIRVIQLTRADLQRAIEFYDKLFIKLVKIS